MDLKCKKCGHVKQYSEFPIIRYNTISFGNKETRSGSCKSCKNLYSRKLALETNRENRVKTYKAYYRNNKERIKERDMRIKNGLPPLEPKIKKQKKFTLGSIHQIVSTTKTSARRRKIPFSEEVTIDFLLNILNCQYFKCAMTGVDIRLGVGRTASLDRIDSSKGYTKDNVQWVSRWYNLSKQEESDEQFYLNCKKFVLHYESKLKK